MKCAAREFYRNPETYADRVFCSEDTFAVADGMGLGKGAVLASSKAVELVGKYKPFSSPGDMEEFFKRANLKIMEEIAKLGDRHITGTTLSVVSFSKGRFVLGHVGDSRVYLLRDGSLKQLTHDQIELRNGRKQVSVLGIDWKLNVLTEEGALCKGDIFLLISDGAVNYLSDKDIRDVLGEDVEGSAEKLLELYREKNPEEDMSFAIVLIE